MIANPSNNKSAADAVQLIGVTETSPRFTALLSWVGAQVGPNFSIQQAWTGSHLRRYFRISAAAKTWLVMDAPPEHGQCEPYLYVATLMRHAELHVPRIDAQDLAQGFLLLEDWGDVTYLQGLQAVHDPDLESDNAVQNKLAHSLFIDAIDTLIQWQLSTKPDALPHYDEAILRRELQLFPDWYVATHRNITLSAPQQKTIDDAFATLVQRNLNQASVFVHRNYVPPNLMICPANGRFASPGILDFQDALFGPICYDIATLFKDASISWKEEQIIDWTIRYWEKARKAELPVPADFSEFYADCEWMALQRHLNLLGSIARASYRDGQPDCLGAAPRLIAYIRHTCDRYRALGPLLTVIDHIESVAPADVAYTF